ncbi:hypothetical protein BJ170DRAFT_697459 [Xylariales sp. AK1849]|nr:hypothetical protein BJ170DRAFT_697459 [Xylariales sp. AK1849]
MQRLVEFYPPESSLFLMVDGLDEYQGDTLVHIELARVLKDWSTRANTKVIYSARPHTEFIDTFDETARVIHLHELTRSDIRCFAHAQFLPCVTRDSNDETAAVFDGIDEHLVDMADGVFLRARPVVRSLLIGLVHDDSPKALLERLNSTPRDINNLLRRILDSVDPTVRHRSDQMLSMALDNPFPHNLNALAYSWLEDLDDFQFPFNRPCEAATPLEESDRFAPSTFPLNLPNPDDIFYIELLQALEVAKVHDDPIIKGLLHQSKRSWHVWIESTGLLAKFATLIQKGNAFRGAYRPATVEELWHPNLAVHGIVSEDAQLVGNYIFNVFGKARY